jgi:hypothetical protein
MAQRGTVINLIDRYIIVSGEPILDTDEGVLIISFDDGTSRTFNWSHVIDFYYLSEGEYERLISAESDR